jgi:hypothetical protein
MAQSLAFKLAKLFIPTVAPTDRNDSVMPEGCCRC